METRACWLFRPNYSAVEIFRYRPNTARVLTTWKTTPPKGKTRQERYEICCKALVANGIKPPEFLAKGRP